MTYLNKTRLKAYSGCLMMLLGLVLALPAVASDWTFTLRPGETMAQLAQRCCGDAALGEQISKANHLDMRYGPPAGSRIRVPVNMMRLQPLSATLVYTVGLVTDGNNQPLESGASLAMGQRLQTGPNSLAVVRFADDSTMRLGAEASVDFDTLSAYGDTGMVDTLVHLQRGRIELRVIKQAGNRLRVETPSGIAAVRGTKFRVAAESDSVARPAAPSRGLVETTSGLVGFGQSAGDEASVEAGYGVVADGSGLTKEELLEPPGPVSVPAAGAAKQQLSWPRLQDARTYRVQVGRDTAGAVQWQPSVLTPQRVFPLQGLAVGDYQVRVRGIAASGLHGLDAAVPVSIAVYEADVEPESKAEPKPEVTPQLEPDPEPRGNRWWLLSLLAVPLLLI